VNPSLGSSDAGIISQPQFRGKLTRLPIPIHKLTKPNAGDRIIFALGASVFGPLAQSEEHLPFKQGVVRSSRTRPIFVV
jgi:hypothetical protein